MQTVIDFVPWILFGLVYKFAGGLYPATAVLMGAMVVPLVYDWVKERRLSQMHLVLAVMVWVFGAATLILHDVRFLQWKASVYYWIIGLALCGSIFIGKRTLLERFLGSSLPEGSSIPAGTWRSSSLIMGAFYLLLGFANIWVAMNRSESDWVTFKVWIAYPIAVVVTMAVMLWTMRSLFGKEEGSP